MLFILKEVRSFWQWKILHHTTLSPWWSEEPAFHQDFIDTNRESLAYAHIQRDENVLHQTLCINSALTTVPTWIGVPAVNKILIIPLDLNNWQAR
jgi:hypothetical protein